MSQLHDKLEELLASFGVNYPEQIRSRLAALELAVRQYKQANEVLARELAALRQRAPKRDE